MAAHCNLANLTTMFYTQVPYAYEANDGSLQGYVWNAFYELMNICCSDAEEAMRKIVYYHNQTALLRAMQTGRTSQSVAMPVFVTLDTPPQYMNAMTINTFVLIASTADQSFSLISEAVVAIWPIVATIWGFTGLVGYILWFVETYFSREKSPYCRTFGRGMMDGFWNAFITGGTIGYGDMVVQSVFGRFIILCWITLASILFSIMTGTCTSVISAVTAASTAFPTISGSTVGVLTNSIDYYLVIQSGGSPVQMSSPRSLIESTINGSITLAFLDLFTYASYYASLSALLQNTRQVVTTQFSAQAGFMLTNGFYEKLTPEAYDCLMQESFLVQYFTSQFAALDAGKLQQVSNPPIANQLLLSGEVPFAIYFVSSILSLIVATEIVYFLVYRYSRAKKHRDAGSNNGQRQLNVAVTCNCHNDATNGAYSAEPNNTLTEL